MSPLAHIPRTRLNLGIALALLAFLTSTFALTSPVSADDTDCDVPSTGAIEESEVPDELSVIECDLVGRTVVSDNGEGLVIPEPGTAVGSESLPDDGTTTGFQLEVAVDGTLSFPEEQSGSGDTSLAASNSSASSPGKCGDQAYTTNDLKEYDTYNWYIGDGGMPAGLSQSAAKTAFADAIDNITSSSNACGYIDQVSAAASYKGTSTYEADMNSSGTCTARDKQSTWDAGNLNTGTVAKTCWWSVPMAGVKNDLLEADVRFNTTDYSFTNSPTSSCSGLFDVRSVGTHEAGHVFGMGHVGSGHKNLTMYTDSFRCSTSARTLGVGDVLGLRSIY